jgi:hypothetical protein
LFIGKKSIPVELFSEALRNENSGNYKEAIATYENALKEVQKIRFPDNNLRKSIIQKLKVLNTAINYQDNVSKKTNPLVEETESGLH